MIMTDIVERLKDTQWYNGDCEVRMEAANEIERLREKCDKQAMILQRLMPDKFPGVYFITGEGGEIDQNGMPNTLFVAPAYGVDFSYVYRKTDQTFGMEW